MANQYTTPNMYNGQYAPPPFYTPYHASPNTPNGGPGASFPQGLQHNQPFPVAAANVKRFEANSHVPSPPLPFQLPPNWNPEVLRQLAASSNMQFPPPPPPPPQMFSAPFIPSPHPAPINTNVQHPPFPPFAHMRPPFQPSTPTPQSGPGQDTMAQENQGRVTEVHRHQPTQHREERNVASPAAHNLDGATFSRLAPLSRTNNEHMQVNTTAVAHNGAVQETEDKQEPRSYEELRAKAKAAVAECVPFGATHQFWLENGVKQPVIDRLFTELNIAMPVAAPAPLTQPRQEVPAAPQATSNTESSLVVSEELNRSANTPGPGTVSTPMERKDRIAMMLAAKKGHQLASAKTSQSGSPAPTEAAVKSVKEINVPPKDGTPHVKSPPRIATDATAEFIEATELHTQPQSASTAQVQSSLPTPVREEMKLSGFSIPGLFMDADEPAPQKYVQQPDHTESVDVHSPVLKKPAEPKSLKRGSDQISIDSLPQAKRQASHFIPTRDTAEMPANVTPPSIDNSPVTPLDKQTVEPKEQPIFSDSEKPPINGISAPRPKVNQEKLKDRMAALKANLMAKNSRKQALQDGMPMLDAEVEKTRERLQSQQARLATVRQIIQTKEIELAEARKEDEELVQDIQKLEEQLADGLTGQKQFSKELTQLNDQIVADEQASGSSERAKPTAQQPVHSVQVAVTKADSDVHLSEKDEQMTTVSQPKDLPQDVPVVDNHGESLLGETDSSLVQADSIRPVNSRALSATARGPEEPVERSASRSDSGQWESNISKTESIQRSMVSTASPSEAELGGDVEMDHDVDDEDRMSIDGVSDAVSDGSASMSDSGSEDYEPVIEDQPTQGEIAEENDDYEPADATPYEPTTEPENDDYEPAEEVDVLNVDNINGAGASPTMISRTALRESLDIDTSPMLSPLDEVVTASTSSTRPATANTLTNQQGIKVAEIPPTIGPLSEDRSLSASRFVPYQSPLSSLKSFRFHPQFNELVKNGYRSLTYSNNIDAKKPLCATELDGQMCMDVKCEDQHFGSMALSGTLTKSEMANNSHGAH